MPYNNFTSFLLNIEDENIEIFEDKYKDHYDPKRNKRIKMCFGRLRKKEKCCPHCNTSSSLIGHGYIISTVRLNKVSEFEAVLKLEKQRYKCKNCNKTFVSKTPLVDRNCSISNPLKDNINLRLRKVNSITQIAEETNVSTYTVAAIMGKNRARRFKRKLPSHICFDEFKSVLNVEGAMSFIYMNAKKGTVFDILPDRKLETLRKHFLAFPKSSRLNVKEVIIDMHSAYKKLVKEVFPNAKIVIDRFHLVQLVNRSLIKTRIEVMKGISTQRNDYKILKRYWKILQKKEEDLNCIYFRKWVYFKRFQCEESVCKYMLSLDNQLKQSYEFAQGFNQALRNNNIDRIKWLIKQYRGSVSSYMETSITTLDENLPYIENTCNSIYTNGVMEGTISRIKLIKRVAYGYRSFSNFRKRIFLILNDLNRDKYRETISKRKNKFIENKSSCGYAA